MRNVDTEYALYVESLELVLTMVDLVATAKEQNLLQYAKLERISRKAFKRFERRTKKFLS